MVFLLGGKNTARGDEEKKKRNLVEFRSSQTVQFRLFVKPLTGTLCPWLSLVLEASTQKSALSRVCVRNNTEREEERKCEKRERISLCFFSRHDYDEKKEKKKECKDERKKITFFFFFVRFSFLRRFFFLFFHSFFSAPLFFSIRHAFHSLFRSFEPTGGRVERRSSPAVVGRRVLHSGL